MPDMTDEMIEDSVIVQIAFQPIVGVAIAELARDENGDVVVDEEGRKKVRMMPLGEGPLATGLQSGIAITVEEMENERVVRGKLRKVVEQMAREVTGEAAVVLMDGMEEGLKLAMETLAGRERLAVYTGTPDAPVPSGTLLGPDGKPI